jgi:hypothetical protein
MYTIKTWSAGQNIDTKEVKKVENLRQEVEDIQEAFLLGEILLVSKVITLIQEVLIIDVIKNATIFSTHDVKRHSSQTLIKA